MKRQIKKEWIEALRSGDYEQGKRFLCKKTPGGDRFCCLGVLLDIAYDGDWEEGYYGWKIQERASTIHPNVQDNLGLTLPNHDFLYRANDKGWSFKKIADWIEENIQEED